MTQTQQHYVVTGGAGFIGSHLVERLLVDGHQVTVIDDFSTGRQENLAAVVDHPHLEVLASRVSETRRLPELVEAAAGVFHLAAAVGVELVINQPSRSMVTNLRETEVVLEACSRQATPILLASTSEVYGKSQEHLFLESDDLLIGPPHLIRWSYACSKLTDEFLAMSYFSEGRMPVRIVRLFNTVGPRQSGRYGMVLPRFIEAARLGKPLRVYGDGSQTRCFCNVSDTVEALVRLQSAEKAVGEVFNVGNDEEVSILDLAQRVIKSTNSTSRMELVPYVEAYAPGFEDMRRRRPSIEKLHGVTQFRPLSSLDDIIHQTAGLE